MSSTGAPSWENQRPEYAVVMPRADCNLQMAVCNERFAGHDVDKVRIVVRGLALALRHLHSRGLVHGDVKPRNVVRINGSWKLIDLDAAAPQGKPVGRKYSSGFSPPELAQLIFNKDGDHVESDRAARYWTKVRKVVRRGGRRYLLRVEADDGHDAGAASPENDQKGGEEKAGKTQRQPAAPTSAGKFVPRPPRQLLLQSAHPTFDVWRFGCVLYFLCTGRRLFAQMDARRQHLRPRRLPQAPGVDRNRQQAPVLHL